MYALLLIGYTVWGGNPPSVTTPSTVRIGTFATPADCNAALTNFNPANSYKPITPMNEYRWALLCAPAGSQTQ
jgi:hypothetical protein